MPTRGEAPTERPGATSGIGRGTSVTAPREGGGHSREEKRLFLRRVSTVTVRNGRGGARARGVSCFLLPRPPRLSAGLGTRSGEAAFFRPEEESAVPHGRGRVSGSSLSTEEFRTLIFKHSPY